MNSWQTAIFGKSVKHARMALHGSIGKLALCTGIPEMKLRRIERGTCMPDEADLLQLITALKLTPDWVFALNDPADSERMNSIIRLIRCFDGQALVSIEQYISRLARSATSAAH